MKCNNIHYSKPPDFLAQLRPAVPAIVVHSHILPCNEELSAALMFGFISNQSSG